MYISLSHYKNKKSNIILLTYNIVSLSLHFKNISIMFSITRIATTIVKVNCNKYIYRYYLKKTNTLHYRFMYHTYLSKITDKFCYQTSLKANYTLIIMLSV